MRLDATPYLQPYYRKRLVHDPAYLTVSDHTFSADEVLKKSWIPTTFRAFSLLTSIMHVQDVLIIGTGIGLDVLGTIEIFDPTSITVTDISEAVLAVAKENINSNRDAHTPPAIHFYVGDMFTCVPTTQQFDLVFENLPTVPAPPHLGLLDADNAAYYFDAQGRTIPVAVEQHLLTSHYLCLHDAYNQVRPGGGVLTSVGGRVPLERVLDMHRLCGYEPRLLAFDMKIQGEPHRMLPSHRAIEEAFGVSFTFYAPDALDIVTTHRKASGLEGQQLFEAVKDQIANYAISTQEALEHFRQGKDVVHPIFMVFGQRPHRKAIRAARKNAYNDTWV
ncbi:MAG: hypothetical protein NVS4B11_21820 [Ktedonobacteraceae bacterium]